MEHLEETIHTAVAGVDTIEGHTTTEQVVLSKTAEGVVGVNLTSFVEATNEVLVLTNFDFEVVVLATVAEVATSIMAVEVANSIATMVATHIGQVNHNTAEVAMGVRHTLVVRAAHIPSSPISSTEFERKPIQTNSLRFSCHKFPSAAQVVSFVGALLGRSTSVANSYFVLP